MTKITPAEFEKWAGWFWETSLSALNSTKFEEGEPEKQEKAKKMISFAYERTKSGCPFTALYLCEGVRAWYETGFIPTLPTYLSEIENRVKEGVEALGYYNSNNPLSPAEINQKWKTGGPSGDSIRNWWTDIIQRTLLINQMEEEEVRFFCLGNESLEGFKKMSPEMKFDNFNKEDYSKMGFFLETLIKIVEKAAAKAKKKKKRFAQFAFSPS
ncbi:MAG: hypothetical protein I3273_02220 [Candidatus Moeniiplasma glomeromycotorum]|nr:hypothetical protein [Candidatus Moeniiplasma glomeromycotorum]MCE8167067.1 hypothetical protein [Candidatus Moeniiplasma glomeromycotorum]MCE8168921.1 hypothetical protein [Candidatus Moeniiplasma glomeromycotorum]